MCQADAKFQELDFSHNAGFPSDPNKGDEADGGGLAMHHAFNPIMHVLEVLGETTVTRMENNTTNTHTQ